MEQGQQRLGERGTGGVPAFGFIVLEAQTAVTDDAEEHETLSFVAYSDKHHRDVSRVLGAADCVSLSRPKTRTGWTDPIIRGPCRPCNSNVRAPWFHNLIAVHVMSVVLVPAMGVARQHRNTAKATTCYLGCVATSATFPQRRSQRRCLNTRDMTGEV